MGIGVHRMNDLMMAAVEGTPADEVVRDERERRFYARMVAAAKRAEEQGMQLIPEAEYMPLD